MKKILSVMLAAAMVLGLAACGSSTTASTTAAPAAETTAAAAETTAAAAAETTAAAAEASAADQVLKLQWTQGSGIDTLFESPWHDLQNLSSYAMYESLISPVGDGTFEPCLASAYEVSSDGLTYTFTIRDGVKWTNGDDFTVDDVVFSLWGVIADPTSNFGAKLTSVVGYTDVKENGAAALSGVKADGNKIIITLTAADRTFLSNISYVKILPKNALGSVAVEELETYEAYWSKPYGTGCWVIDEVSFPDYFTMVANENYWGGESKIKKALFTSYQTGGGDALVAGLIAGDVDFAYGNNVNDIEAAKNICAQNADMEAPLITSYYTRLFIFNCGERADGNVHADIAKEDVRKALALLIDREAAASCYAGQSVGLTSLVNPASAMYNSDIPLFERNVEEAKKLLDGAGFDYSQELNIAYYYNDQNTIDIMDMVVQNLADAGIKAEAHLLTGDLGTQIYTDCNFDMIYCGTSNADPITYYHECTSESYYTFMHAVEERGAIFDDLYAQYLTSTTDADAKKAAAALQVAGIEHPYQIPVYSLNNVVIYNKNKLVLPESYLTYGENGGYHLTEWAFK